MGYLITLLIFFKFTYPPLSFIKKKKKFFLYFNKRLVKSIFFNFKIVLIYEY
jgi:hypothetical protein